MSYKRVADFLSISGLKVNDDKTRSMTARKRKTSEIALTVRTADTQSYTSKIGRLLGSLVLQDINCQR